MDMTLKRVVKEWNERLNVAGRCHYIMADRKRRLGIGINALAIAVTVISGVISFASPFGGKFSWILAGACSIAGASLMLAVFLLDPDEGARNHAIAASEYYALRRRVEIMAHSKVTLQELHEIEVRYSEISAAAPVPLGRVYERARLEVKSRS